MTRALWVVVSLIAASTVSAQNLDRENPPPALLEWSRVDGTGAVIKSCEVLKNQSLRCKTDREITRVDCSSNTSYSSGGEEAPFVAKSLQSDFACAPENRSEFFNTSLKVFLLSADGKLSEYLIRYASAENVEKTFMKELQFRNSYQRPIFSEASLTPLMEQWLGLTARTGLASQAKVSDSLTGHLRWMRPGDELAEWDVGGEWSLGLELKIASSPKYSLGLEYISMDRQATHFDAVKVYGVFRQKLIFERLLSKWNFALMYPSVQSLRQAYSVGADVEWGPLMGGRLTVTAGVNYMNQVWTINSTVPVPWDVSGLIAQAGIRLNFDTESNATH